MTGDQSEPEKLADFTFPNEDFGLFAVRGVPGERDAGAATLSARRTLSFSVRRPF
jgi:hypothetical protein